MSDMMAVAIDNLKLKGHSPELVGIVAFTG
ncbi:MAG: hypothetical protein JWR15_529 [Prosthecobacter sp.]|nr:hypothetical protein [Prosthecobacter sp.]